MHLKWDFNNDNYKVIINHCDKSVTVVYIYYFIERYS